MPYGLMALWPYRLAQFVLHIVSTSKCMYHCMWGIKWWWWRRWWWWWWWWYLHAKAKFALFFYCTCPSPIYPIKRGYKKVNADYAVDLYSAPSWEAHLWSAQVWIAQFLHCKHMHHTIGNFHWSVFFLCRSVQFRGHRKLPKRPKRACEDERLDV